MITVLGHTNPDADSICAAISYAWLLNQRGQEAQAAAAGPVNRESKYILDRFHIPDLPVLHELAPGQPFALVDTNNADELLPGWQQASLLSIVDHHRLIGNMITEEGLSMILEPVGSSATVVLGLMDQANLTPDPAIAGVMLAGVVADTLNLAGPTTTDVDRQAVERLAQLANTDPNDLAHGIFAAASDLTGLEPLDIFNSNSKLFDFTQENLRIAALETADPAAALALRPQLEEAMRQQKEAEPDISGAMFFIVDVLHNCSDLLVPSDHERDIAARAFNLEFSGDVLHLPGIVSRKKQIRPALKAILD